MSNHSMASNDEPHQAFLAIDRQLQGFTSPVVIDDPDDMYDGDATNWMERALERVTPMSTGSPKKSTPLLQRSLTPIMSNSSSRKNLRNAGSSTYASPTKDVVDSEMYTEPAPVQTPYVENPVQTLANVQAPASAVGSHRLYPTTRRLWPSSMKQSSFCRYHEVLLSFLQSKRRLDTQLELENQQMALTKDTDDSAERGKALLSMSLAEQQTRAEVDYCKTLSQLGYALAGENTDMVEEGHAWKLLADLRKLGVEALFWHDDSVSVAQNDTMIDFFLRGLTGQVRSTPKEIVDSLLSPTSGSPMPLRRKHQLVLWIRSCLEQESKASKILLPQPTMISHPFHSTHPDGNLKPSIVSELDVKRQKMLMQTCLFEVMEGNIRKACDLVTSHGQPLKAALWCGGEPYGYDKIVNDEQETVERIPTGNPNRFLWKRSVWKAGRRLMERQNKQQNFGASSSTDVEESAIYSILANDVINALDNPSIRESWSKSLGILLNGAWERVVDETLQRHSSNRRRSSRPGYPGSQYENEENEQLMQTQSLKGMKESQILISLASRPFLQKHVPEREIDGRKLSYKSAIMSFAIGVSAILEFCDHDTSRFLSTLTESGDSDNDWKGLRFLTHLLLFVDSFHVSTSVVSVNNFTRNKDLVLFEYIKYLESRPDLWKILSLYVSLLPQEKILDFYPEVLAKVLNNSERTIIIEQIRDLMPNVAICILRKVVRFLLNASSSCDFLEGKEADEIKCHSLFWLMQEAEHFGDALICSNILMRDFLLCDEEDKMDVAIYFFNEVLPPDITIKATESVSYPGFDGDEAFLRKVDRANLEHFAFDSYLSAHCAFAEWKDALKEVRAQSMGDALVVDVTRLNPTELDVADRTHQKHWLREMRARFEQVIDIAEEARLALHKMLTYPGGWLSLGYSIQENFTEVDNEELVRLEQIRRIRSRHLVLAVNLYHEVCEETASWILRSYEDAANVGLVGSEILASLDPEISEQCMSRYSLTFWYKHAMNLSMLIADDSNGIHKVFPKEDLTELLEKISEIVIAGLLNT